MGFGGVEDLSRGSSEHRHVIEEKLHISRGEGPEERLHVVSILGGMDLETGDHLEADDRTGLEPAEEGPSDEEIERRRQRTALPHPRSIAEEGGDKTVDVGGGRGGGEDGGDPLLQPRSSPDLVHDAEEELAVDRIIGLPEVEEGED
jgi:hypothetical protein